MEEYYRRTEEHGEKILKSRAWGPSLLGFCSGVRSASGRVEIPQAAVSGRRRCIFVLLYTVSLVIWGLTGEWAGIWWDASQKSPVGELYQALKTWAVRKWHIHGYFAI